MFLSQAIPLSDFSSTAEARRAGARMAASLGLNETKSGEMAIVITEAARNAVVYGGGGQLLLSGIKSRNETRMEIVALDRGPGIADLSLALQDGYSTGGTPGTGLGAIQRTAEVFDVFSNAKGTAIFARIEQTENGAHSRKSFSRACRAGLADCRRDSVWRQCGLGDQWRPLHSNDGGWIGPWRAGSGSC